MLHNQRCEEVWGNINPYLSYRFYLPIIKILLIKLENVFLNFSIHDTKKWLK